MNHFSTGILNLTLPAKAIDNVLPLAPSPSNTQLGISLLT